MTDVSTEEGSFGQKRIEYNSPADFADFRRKKNLNYTDVWLAEDTVSANLRRLRELKIN